MVPDLFNRLCFLIDEIERINKESPVPEGESHPALLPLLDEASAIVRQLDPLFRERYRDEPEKLAQWLDIIKDYPDILAEDEAERVKAEAEAAKEAEGHKLAAEMRAVMDRINADIVRLMAHDGPDLETEAVLERSFAALHDLDAEMRVRCRDFPEQLEKWKVLTKELEEVEALFERGRELEELEPAN